MSRAVPSSAFGGARAQPQTVLRQRARPRGPSYAARREDRARRVEVCAFVDADPKPIDQFAAEPARDEAKHDRAKRATGLGAALALRPRRRGTPRRSSAVVQTQIILAIIGALVMLVVGASLARAFGVVGAAGLVRYRSKIEDPKDAGVMLSTLALGLAAGVGLYLLSLFAAFFIMGVLWLIESFEPHASKLFTLKVTSKDAVKLQPRVEQLLRRQRARFELRTSSPEEISYEVQLPIEIGTDRLSTTILQLDQASNAAVVWDEKKKKEQG